jgi:transposase, IS5 family
MRITMNRQLFLAPARIATDFGAELMEVDKILSNLPEYPAVLSAICSELSDGVAASHGREGLTAEQVVKLSILKRRQALSYRELSNSTCDSLAMMKFLNITGSEGISKSRIHANLTKVSLKTWELLDAAIVRCAQKMGFETGAVVRADTTTTETNIHYPTDASLLTDSVRVLSRVLGEAKRLLGKDVVSFENHTRRAKTKLYLINNTRKQAERYEYYLELIRVCRRSHGYATKSLEHCAAREGGLSSKAAKVHQELLRLVPLVEKVIDQAYRRIVEGEQVPSEEKVVSLFEDHTSIIVKGARDVVFGHKVMIVGGASGLVLHSEVLEGNPADSSLVKDMITNVQERLGVTPEAVALDGCFGSTENRDYCKKAGVKNLTFCKNRSLNIDTLMSDSKHHKLLRNFRAGIEGTISYLKRCFGFARVIDRGLAHFRTALQTGAIAHNLTLLARMSLAASAG